MACPASHSGAKQEALNFTLVIDARIATNDNLRFLKEQGNTFIMVSGEKRVLLQEKCAHYLITVKEDGRDKVEANCKFGGDKTLLYCFSIREKAKEQNMRKLWG